MATQSLSPNRIAQKLREHRHAVIVLAHQSARKAIKAQLRAEGLKLSQFSAKDISIRAEAWFDVHRQELIAEAEHAIATWPGFERWRLPPGHEMFVKSHKSNTRQKQTAQSQDKSSMADAAPTTTNRTTEKEVEKLIEAARKRGRNGTRDSAAILLAYRHGLRAQELCQLRWSQVDLRDGRLHVNRISVHPLHGPDLRALRPLQGTSPYVFVTEAGSPVTTAWFLRMVQRTGKASLPRSSAHAASFDRIQACQRRP